jgi:hypothetical protein
MQGLLQVIDAEQVPVEHACCKGAICVGLLKYFHEMLLATGAA